MHAPDESFHLRRFLLLTGGEMRLYCRLRKVREALFVTCRLYQDRQGREWVEVEAGGQGLLAPLAGETFEQRVAAELNALGLNKYSG